MHWSQIASGVTQPVQTRGIRTSSSESNFPIADNPFPTQVMRDKRGDTELHCGTEEINIRRIARFAPASIS